jgi:hypothetical protein
VSSLRSPAAAHHARPRNRAAPKKGAPTAVTLWAHADVGPMSPSPSDRFDAVRRRLPVRRTSGRKAGRRRECVLTATAGTRLHLRAVLPSGDTRSPERRVIGERSPRTGAAPQFAAARIRARAVCGPRPARFAILPGSMQRLSTNVERLGWLRRQPEHARSYRMRMGKTSIPTHGIPYCLLGGGQASRLALRSRHLPVFPFHGISHGNAQMRVRF